MGRIGEGLSSYYKAKIEELEIQARDKQHNLRRLEAQRNELNTKGIAQAPSQRALWGSLEQSESKAEEHFCSAPSEGRASAPARTRLVCGRGC